MDTANILYIFTKTGLVLNIVGTLILALSFGKKPADVHQLDEKRRKIYLVSFRYPQLFYWGIGLIILGFILQLVI
jgi:hypothetical protein